MEKLDYILSLCNCCKLRKMSFWISNGVTYCALSLFCISDNLKDTMYDYRISWWLIELPCWFKASFFPKMLEINRTKYEMIILHQVRFNPCKVRLDQTAKNSEKWNFENFMMFSSIWPQVGWISLRINPHEVTLMRVRWATKVKFFTPWFSFFFIVGNAKIG